MNKDKKRVLREKFLLLRFGGMGDVMFMTPVIKELAKRGFIVDVATNEYSAPLLENNKDVHEIIVEQRFGPVQVVDGQYPCNLVNRGEVWMPDLGLYDSYKTQTSGEKDHGSPLYPYNVCNYYRVIENNGHHPQSGPSQNSDFINTYDTHLSWAHIDPNDLDPEDRRPVYKVKESERQWAKSVLKDLPHPLIMVQVRASSPVRSYHRISEILETLKSKPGSILLWEPREGHNQGEWKILRSDSPVTGILFPKDIPSIRASAALLEQSDLLISADTCLSHVSEALNKWHITFYTSVPAWTRSRDYKYEITVDARIPYKGGTCKCCVINRDCPRVAQDALKSLTKQETDVLSLLNQDEKNKLGIPFPTIDTQGKQPHEYFGCTPDAMNSFLQAAISKLDARRQQEAYCLQSLKLAPIVEETWNKLFGGENA